ncbi:TetR/AcrR family transcriptional regulator [Streptomyces sp. NPDC026206]|uniref:TetR/AcrR family transcriptional regulator n=1 Tax=Streptomyces sp. NPDC026206 TaxID=3157089 RepID=UPI0033EE2DFD
MAGGNHVGSPRASFWLAGKADGPKRKAEPGGEGALDRDRIVAVTVRLLDAEGLAKFSMRRLAAELGVTAMSVYWYVDNKDDLLELALDAVTGEMVIPAAGEEPADWRDHLRHLAREYRSVLSTHPWVPQLVGRYLNIGPRSMAFSDAVMAVMRRSGMRADGLVGALNAVFQFVYGFATVEGLYKERCRSAGMSEDEYFTQVMDMVVSRPEFTDTYKEAAEIIQERNAGSIAEMRERDFAFALDTVIAGIEVMRDRQDVPTGT